MVKKTFFILVILLKLFLIISSTEENNNETNKENSNSSNSNETFPHNPYLILKIPPWSKFKDVVARYSRLKDKLEANQLNEIQFQIYTKAFEKIKEDYIKNNKTEKTFSDVLSTTFRHIFFYELIILVLLSITWFIFKFTTYVAILVGTFVAIDNIIPHWFNNMQTQYLVSFALGTIIYYRNFFCKKKQDEVGDGRKKFQKIE